MGQHNFDQPANVLWYARIPPSGKIEGGETQHFSRLDDAIRFVMEKIPANVRSTAWITTDGPAIDFPELEGLYNGLPKKP